MINFATFAFNSCRNNVCAFKFFAAFCILDFHPTQRPAMFSDKAFINTAFINISTFFDKDINKPIGVSEYRLSDFVPAELIGTLLSAGDIEKRIKTDKVSSVIRPVPAWPGKRWRGVYPSRQTGLHRRL